MVAVALERTVLDRAADHDAAHVWRDVRAVIGGPGASATSAQLTLVRNSDGDFRDRQVYIWVDGESWGKLKYGVPLSAEIPAGAHKVRANNTLFNDTLEFTAAPGEHVRVRCTNGMPRAGWLMLILLHATWLRVTLEREL
jgi:hypothetical protein